MLHVQDGIDWNRFEKAVSSDAQTCRIPLFHGTRRRGLTVTREERETFYAACREVMMFAKRVAADQRISDEALAAYAREQNPDFLGSTVALYNTSKYRYGALYVTSSYTHALRFSRFAGGELGAFAHAQCRGFEHFGIALDEPIQTAADRIRQEYMKYRESEPVVLVFQGVRFADLTNEGGAPFLSPVSDEYNRFVIRELHESIDTDDDQIRRNFSLSHVERYTALVLPERDFRTGFSWFTEIDDVDTALEEAMA